MKLTLQSVRSRRPTARSVVATLTLTITVGGCAKPSVSTEQASPPALAEKTAPLPGPATQPTAATQPAFAAAAPEADPIAYFRRVAEKAAALPRYRLTFIRQERLGLIPSLRPVERIDARFRAEPFSVHFRWLEPESEYVECAYVKGENDNKVVLRPRKGLFGLPPSVGKYNVEDAVAFQKARNPITDFGLARMMRRTIDRIGNAQRHGGAPIQYLGVKPSGDSARPAHHFEIRFPKGDPFPSKRMDLYVDAESELPTGVYLWLPGGELDAKYLYENLVHSPPVEPGEFTVAAPPAEKGGKSATALKSGRVAEKS